MGDLIYGNDRVFDLYSLKDFIPAAMIRGCRPARPSESELKEGNRGESSILKGSLK